MRLSCTICYELFVPTDDVCAAVCGHILHYKCWVDWLRRSKNCPDCRRKTNVQDLFRLFFNIGDGDDLTTLSNKYDALRCDLSCKTTECEAVEKKLKLQKEENIKLQQELQKLRTENQESRKRSGRTVAEDGADMVNVGLCRSYAEEVMSTKLKEEISKKKKKKKAEEFQKRMGVKVVDISKKYSEAEMSAMRVFEDIVRYLKYSLPQYEDLKKHGEFLKSLKVYTDQVDSTTDLWDDVDCEPDKYVELFKDVKRFLGQKEKREEELSHCPRGCVLELSGIPKSTNISWHDIRVSVENFDVGVAFVTFNPGDQVAFVRLEEDFVNHSPALQIAKKLNGRIRVGDIVLILRALRGGEELDFLRRSLEARDQRKRKRFRKRRGYEDHEEDEETLLDMCMRMAAESKPRELPFCVQPAERCDWSLSCIPTSEMWGSNYETYSEW